MQPESGGTTIISATSQIMITWALGVVGGSIATIVSTSHLRPTSECFRLAYLLFLPGWVLLANSIWHGNEIARRLIAIELVPNEEARVRIGSAINSSFARQLRSLRLGLVCFGLWLVAFLLWWIFGTL